MDDPLFDVYVLIEFGSINGIFAEEQDALAAQSLLKEKGRIADVIRRPVIYNFPF